MNRRDFLLFRTEEGARVVELSCRRLALRDLEWRLTASGPAADTPDDITEGEPPAAFDTQSVDQALDALARNLTPRDVLRLVDAEWVPSDDLRGRIEAIVSNHRTRGGRVEQVGT